MEAHTCDHPACSCQIEGDSGFCSEYCEEAAQDVARNDTCDCDHPQCAPRP